VPSHVITVRVPEALGERLDDLAARTNRTRAFYTREALEAYLEDIEDYYLAAELSRQVATGEMPLADWADLRRELGAA